MDNAFRRAMHAIVLLAVSALGAEPSSIEERAVIRPSDRVQREIEVSFRNDEEAHELLGLINAQFQSEPMSRQCFDLRVVDRVKRCVEMRKRFLGNLPHAWRPDARDTLTSDPI